MHAHIVLGLDGIWHTHPVGYSEVSSADMDTMFRDLMSATAGDTPGIPPVSMVATRCLNGSCTTINVYVTTYEVKCETEKLPYEVMHFHAGGVANDDFVKDQFNFAGIHVEEGKGGKYVINQFMQLNRVNSKDINGIFIGATVPPPHAVPVILRFTKGILGNEFYLFVEYKEPNLGLNHGLYKVNCSDFSFKPTIVKGEIKEVDLGLGIKNRLEKLKEHNIDLLKFRDRKIALFGGVGFIGSRVLERVVKLFNEVAVVDYDIVGEENIGYQSLYGID